MEGSRDGRKDGRTDGGKFREAREMVPVYGKMKQYFLYEMSEYM